MRVFSYQKLSEPQRERLRKISGVEHAAFLNGVEPDDDPPLEFLNASICFGNPPAEWLRHSTQLKWIQLISVGFGVRPPQHGQLVIAGKPLLLLVTLLVPALEGQRKCSTL